MNTSEQINELAAALAKAQGAMKNATLNKTVKTDKYTFRFADLPQVRDTVTPTLSANGIAVVQAIGEGAVITRLVHSSGQWIESVCQIPPGQTMQALGSAITYARRYSLSAICGISSEEDDDGNASTDAIAKFDDVGYSKWLTNLALSTADGFEALVETVKSGPQTFQDALRADKKAWTGLKNACKKEAVPA